MQNVPEAGAMSPEDTLRKIADLRMAVLRLRERLESPKNDPKSNCAISLQIQTTNRRIAALEASLPKLRLVASA